MLSGIPAQKLETWEERYFPEYSLLPSLLLWAGLKTQLQVSLSQRHRDTAVLFTDSSNFANVSKRIASILFFFFF